MMVRNADGKIDIDDSMRIFLMRNKEYINKNDFEMLYINLFEYQPDYISLLTQLLLEAELNPLDSVDYIPSGFLENTNIKNFTIPEHITAIGSYAFKTCSKLENIEIPSSVESIAKSVFEDCLSLKTVDLSNVQTIGSRCFYNCKALSKVILSNKLKKIDPSAFYMCTSLYNINFNGSKEDWKNIASYSYRNLKIICTDGILH